jgi:hypothetical protein
MIDTVAALMNDASFRQSYLSGDQDAARRFQEAVTDKATGVALAIAGPAGLPPGSAEELAGLRPGDATDAVASFRAVGLNPTQIGEVFTGRAAETGQPWDRATVEAARARREFLSRDKEWLSRYLAGDSAARAESLKLSIILASEAA